VYPRIVVSLTTNATANFGWRRIVRSTTAGSPVSSYVGASGLRVESYDDAVAARQVHDALMAALIGAEAGRTTVRFDLGSTSTTSMSVQQVNGTYQAYSATSYVSYTSWLDGNDQTLTHEYGHAWSLYYAYVVQQDPSLASYLQARGLAGDSRVGSSYEWSPREMIAEDYRQLFGSPNAQAAMQMNTQIPPAAAVPGLKDFLQNTYTQPPAGSGGGSTGGSIGGGIQPALAVSGVAVNPQPVTKSGTVSFDLSAPAAVTVRILDAGGAVVRTLLTNAPKPAGAESVTWDRKNASGRRVSSGTYTASVQAVDSAGHATGASTNFSVS
jgi:hypothetical protein